MKLASIPIKANPPRRAQGGEVWGVGTPVVSQGLRAAPMDEVTKGARPLLGAGMSRLVPDTPAPRVRPGGGWCVPLRGLHASGVLP